MDPMRHVAAAAAFFGMVAPGAAQVVSTSLGALTPLSVQMTSGTLVASATLPAGALPASGGLVASPSPGARAAVGWGAVAGHVFLDNHVESNVGGPPASGFAGPHEFLVTFTASAPAPAFLEMTRRTTATPGQPWPTVAIDVGNDGTIDVPNLQSGGVGPLTVGPQPVMLRVILASQLVTAATNGVSATNVEFSLRPFNNVTILQSAIGCAPASLRYDLGVAPSFVGTGVSVGLPASADLMVIVFGLRPQPLLLPSVLGQACLLVPSLDVLLVPAIGMPAIVPVPLPASLRPATFHVQAVGLSPLVGLATTDGFTIMAF